eukprot:m.10163 g.10163  ORF g.10163 m.10163 type:complete len:552 (+) comp4211_c0_seq1:182-1837(+)
MLLFIIISSLLCSNSVYAEKDGGLCTPMKGTNCFGNDITMAGVVGDSATCCQKCQEHPLCGAWTWNANEGSPPHECWLKYNCAGNVSDANSVSGVTPVQPKKSFINGVNMGGWLLTETSWMYDQFNSPAEADWIAASRRGSGDAYTIQTMKNHWAGYIPDKALDTLAQFGTNTVRIPIGYWIMDTPVSGGSTMYDFGFNHEGFVTGGINYLEAMLVKLKARNIKALIDIHAMPGGSSKCQSYAGWQVNDDGFWQGASPPEDNTTAIISGCGGGAGPYYSSRGNAKTWLELGAEYVVKVGDWIVGVEQNSSVSGVIMGMEVVNEPGLGWSGIGNDIRWLANATVPIVQGKFKANNLKLDIILNFIGPNEQGMGAWVKQQQTQGILPNNITIDYHNYYNWDGQLSWSQLNAKICGTSPNNSPWQQYVTNDLPVVIGEWSQSTNLGAKAFTDLTNPQVVGNLTVLWGNQISLYATTSGVVGNFHWALRMGSGWQPSPSSQYPNGHQIAGTDWDHSLPGFGPAVWNMGELIRVGVATPMHKLNITGLCQCSTCHN